MQDSKRIPAATLLAALALAGCGSNPTKQEIGTVSGAAAGAYVGNRIGRQLDH